MPTDNPRILDLRRRVQADPRSIAFAQLGEELRRDGATAEAVAVCRTGLSVHPGYLSARVTLGRALVELGRLDEAFDELSLVLDTAPGNLPAIRALAEIYQRRGMLGEALDHYRRALQLAQYDTTLENTVDRIQKQVEQGPAAGGPPSPERIEELFDFDSLLEQLGPPAPPPPSPPAQVPAPSVVESVELQPDARDSFALMERLLRDREELRLQQERAALEADSERRRTQAVHELEGWLSAIVADRNTQQA